ncbi:mCG144841, partial [Mus musculus]
EVFSEIRARLEASKIKQSCLCSHRPPGSQASIGSCSVLSQDLNSATHACAACTLLKAMSSTPEWFLSITRLARFNFSFAPSYRHFVK